MAITDEWRHVEEAFERLDTHPSLAPTLAAMRHLVNVIRADPALAPLHPHVTLASLLLGREGSQTRVYVAWEEGSGYEVAFIDPMMELSGARPADGADVLGVLREFVANLP